MNNNKTLIYGKHPFFSTLKNSKRKIYSLHVAEQNKKEFCSFVENNKINIKNINVNFASNRELNNSFSKFCDDKNHQGYLMFVAEKQKVSFDDFINENKERKILPNLLILDQILDPHNLGALIRSAVAFNVYNIIITYFKSVKETSVVAKSSVGLNEIVNIIEVVNLNNTLEQLKKIGYFVYGLDGEAKTSIENLKDSKNTVLVLGNEGKGIRDLVKRNCDELIKIKMNSEVDSLNVSVAGAIAMYEIWG